MRKTCVFLVLILSTAWGCSFLCPKPVCEPKIEVKEVPIPVYVGVNIPLPDCQELPPLPPYPGDDATAEEKKAWAVDLGEIRDQRDTLNQGCIDALTHLIETVNEHADMIDESWEPSQ
jgi:hypothetical protein